DEQKRTEAARDEAERLRGIADAGRLEEARLRGIADTARADVEREREKLAVFEYGRTMQLAHQEWRDGNVAATLALLDGTREDLRGWEWHYVHRLCHSELLALKGHTKQVWSAAFSPDGTRIVTASHDHTARVWDAKTGAELLALTGHTERVLSAAFSPDGSRILTASVDTTARVWDAKTGAELLALKGHAGRVNSAAFSPDGSRILTASSVTTRIYDSRPFQDTRPPDPEPELAPPPPVCR
ncbi:MAG TPA: hypothetical protein VKE74_19535, partial [Gemmataceae bacterium]|nr:hypothetical protein [Gemmataceae bacterium]